MSICRLSESPSRHFLSLRPRYCRKNGDQHECMDNVAMQHQPLRKKGANAYACQESSTKAGRDRPQEKERSDDLARPGENAEPLSQADAIEFSNHHRRAGQLEASGSQ